MFREKSLGFLKLGERKYVFYYERICLHYITVHMHQEGNVEAQLDGLDISDDVYWLETEKAAWSVDQHWQHVDRAQSCVFSDSENEGALLLIHDIKPTSWVITRHCMRPWYQHWVQLPTKLMRKLKTNDCSKWGRWGRAKGPLLGSSTDYSRRPLPRSCHGFALPGCPDVFFLAQVD